MDIIKLGKEKREEKGRETGWVGADAPRRRLTKEEKEKKREQCQIY